MSVIIGKWRRTSWGWDLLEMKGMICETINRQEIISALREVKLINKYIESNILR